MDAIILTSVVNKISEPQNETFSTNSNETDNNSRLEPLMILSLLLSVLIGCIAANLSWNCNTAKGVDFGLKILFAIFAFLFGLIYIILYLIFLSDCGKQ